MIRMSDMKQTSIYLDQIDREAIEIIKAHFGVSTNSDAARLAIRRVAREIASMEKEKD